MFSCKDLTYHVGSFVLQPFSLSIAAGECFVLTGPSGAGKTVVLELVAGLRRPTGGTITVNQKDYTLAPPQDRPVGLLFQDYALFPHRNVARNIGFGLEHQALKHRAPDAAEQTAHVQELARDLGIEPLLERYPHTLSGGEKQRVALARTLAVRPHLLLLDEPLSALDAPLRQASMDVIKGLKNRGIAILYVTHNPEEAAYLADRSGVMEQGKLFVP